MLHDAFTLGLLWSGSIGFGDSIVPYTSGRPNVISYFGQECRKRYPIAIGMGTDTLPQFRQEGLGKNIKAVLGDDITGDAVMLVNKAPHPNAAKVYVNWLLSQKTQNRLAQIALLNSRRADVKPGDPELALDPKRMRHYFDISDEQNFDTRLKIDRLAKELLK